MLPSDVLGVTIYNVHAGGFRIQAGPHLQQFPAGRRDQPHHAQDAIGAARSHERKPGHHRRPLALPAASLHGDRHAESGGAPRHLPAAGIAARPLPDAAAHRLSRCRQRARDLRNSERDRAAGPPSGPGGRRRPAACRTPCTASPWKRRWSITCSPSWKGRGNHESLALGVSPRGSQALYRAVQALALLEGRDYAIPDDVKRLAVAAVRPSRGHQYAHHPGAAPRRRGRAHHRRNPQPGGSSPVEIVPSYENSHHRPAHGRQDLSVHHPHRRPSGDPHRLHRRAHRRRQACPTRAWRRWAGCSSRRKSRTPRWNTWTCRRFRRRTCATRAVPGQPARGGRVRPRAAPVRRRNGPAREGLGGPAPRHGRRGNRADPERSGGGGEAAGAAGKGPQEDQESRAGSRVRAAGEVQGGARGQPAAAPAGARRGGRKAHSRLPVSLAEAHALRAEPGRGGSRQAARARAGVSRRSAGRARRTRP